MVAFANVMPGVDRACAIFVAISGAGVISMVVAPIVSKPLRFFPPVVPGTSAAAPAPKLPGPIPMVSNRSYGALDNTAIADAVQVFVLLPVKYTKGFVATISVLLGIVAGCRVAVSMGTANLGKVGNAHRFDIDTPFAFVMPTFDVVMILTTTPVMSGRASPVLTGQRWSRRHRARRMNVVGGVPGADRAHGLMPPGPRRLPAVQTA